MTRLMLLGAIVLGTSTFSTPPAPKRHPVSIVNFAYEPVADTVAAGDVLVFTNRDIVPHTVTKAGTLESGSIAAGASWRYRARHRGTIRYQCRFHPTMQGTIVVR